MTKAEAEIIWGSIDWNRVASEIKTFELSDETFEDVKLCVYSAAERWLLWDLQEFQVTGVEHLFLNETPEPGVKAYLDVVGFGLGVNSKLKPYKNRRVVIDWKTTHRPLDKKWKDNQVMSHQWRIYSLLSDADLFIYRGIKCPAKLTDPVEFREIILDVPPEVKKAALFTIKQAGEQIAQLGQRGEVPWPKTMPSYCFAYNRECPYLTDCDLEVVIPGIPKARVLSYTRIGNFLNCPEYHRRSVLDLEENEEEGTDTDASIFGSAVHAGMAEVYAQVFKLDRTPKVR